MLLLSGGVSAGKYDIVERVLADLGARFFFDRVLIQPGQPLVFGASRREVLLRTAGESGVDHGDVRIVRARRDRTPERSERRSPAAACERRLTSRFSSQARLDAVSAGAIERGWRKRDAAAVAGIGRRGRFGARQRVSGGGSGSRSVGGGRRYPGTAQMKKLSHYDATGRARMVDVSGKAGHAPHRDRAGFRADSPVRSEEAARRIPRAIRWKSPGSRESLPRSALPS